MDRVVTFGAEVHGREATEEAAIVDLGMVTFWRIGVLLPWFYDWIYRFRFFNFSFSFKESKGFVMNVVIHKSGKECWWWGSSTKLKSDQVSGVMLKGKNKVMWSDNYML